MKKYNPYKRKSKWKNAIPQNVIKMKNAIYEDSYVRLIFLINFPNKINRPNIFFKRHMPQDIYNKNNLSNLILSIKNNVLFLCVYIFQKKKLQGSYKKIIYFFH